MKGIIIYQGKYGATRQYAQWLAGSLRLPLLRAEDATSAGLLNYDFIVLGTSVYVGKFVMRRWLNHNTAALANKKIFLFIVCGTTADNQLQQQVLIKNNVDQVIADNCEIFFLPGRCVVSGLSWKDRLVLKIGAMLERDPQKKAAMNRGFDGMDQKHLSSLVGRIDSYRKSVSQSQSQSTNKIKETTGKQSHLEKKHRKVHL